MVAPVRICVATHDGHSERIGQHVCRRLTEHGVAAELHVLPSATLTPAVLADSPMVAVIAAVRYGHHLPQAMEFLSRYNEISPTPPLAFVSVNLTARKPNRQTAEDSPYVRKTIAKFKLRPVIACAIAGRLDYPRYGWFDRQIIRFIMALTGGPTDGVSTIEYTQWDRVDGFADAIAATLLSPGAPPR